MLDHSSIYRPGRPRQASLYETLASIVRRGPCVSTFSCCVPVCPPELSPAASALVPAMAAAAHRHATSRPLCYTRLPPAPSHRFLRSATLASSTAAWDWAHAVEQRSSPPLPRHTNQPGIPAQVPLIQLTLYPAPAVIRPWLTRLPLALKGKWSDGPTNMWRHREPRALRRLAAPSWPSW